MTDTLTSDLSRFAELDAQLVSMAKNIKILSNLAWDPQLGQRFLHEWHQGNPTLPEVHYRGRDFRAAHESLRHFIATCPNEHPIARYLAKTAESFAVAAAMLECMGRAAFTEISIQLYGAPTQVIGPSGVTVLEAAEHFIAATDSFRSATAIREDEYCVLPSVVADELRQKIVPFFSHHPVEVVLDSTLASKAAAGARKIRIRGNACFSWPEVSQMLQHEAFVHTLTMLNGREQPHLKSMGLGSPRTTRTQEGLAILAERVTGVIDLSRLRRIALRVKAIDLAMKGADFIDIFKFFLAAGQSETESFYSSMRVFRGGDVRGRLVCTKDVVYLEGLILVETFLLKAIEAGKLDYIHHLFAGRLALADVFTLESYFDNGFIAAPIYEPEWAKNLHCITASLLYSSFANRIRLDQLHLEDFAFRDF
jgi:uncharacterized protein (TIGR02421 family)